MKWLSTAKRRRALKAKKIRTPSGTRTGVTHYLRRAGPDSRPRQIAPLDSWIGRPLISSSSSLRNPKSWDHTDSCKVTWDAPCGSQIHKNAPPARNHSQQPAFAPSRPSRLLGARGKASGTIYQANLGSVRGHCCLVALPLRRRDFFACLARFASGDSHAENGNCRHAFPSYHPI